MIREGVNYSRDIEAAILGVCMLEAEAFSNVHSVLHEKHFYFDDHKKIFEAMRARHESGLPVNDILLVAHDVLQKHGEDLHCNKGHANPYGSLLHFMTTLTNNVVSSAHITHHAAAMLDMWKTRELQAIRASGFSSGSPSQQAYDMHKRITDLLAFDAEKDWYSMDELVMQIFKHQEAIASGKYKFVTTGFQTLDKENGGFAGGNMIVLGARPSVGKSAVLVKMAMAAAKRETVGIITLEMNNVEIASRIASVDTLTPFSKIYRNLFIDEREHMSFYQYLTKNTINLPIYVSDKAKQSMGEIRAKAIKLKKMHNLGILFIDYLQLVDSGPNEARNRSREQEVSGFSRGIKLLAKELDIPVVVLCQLSRAATQRGQQARYPKLSDLRESGAIEQDADVVLMLHRDWMAGVATDEDGNSTEHQADLLAQKWRNGATIQLPLDFDGARMLFTERGFFKHYIPDEEIKDETNPF
jgi:replicative DNA helicase